MSVAERAYLFAKERILDGRYTGGELISEGDVAAGVGVSRTPVREAFLRLETEGLLRLYPKRGALVVPVSSAEVESVMETRLLVEQFAIEKVIRSEIDLGSRPWGSHRAPGRAGRPPRRAQLRRDRPRVSPHLRRGGGQSHSAAAARLPPRPPEPDDARRAGS
jgi:DNA-binding transcriptional regulator YhcF (GntR family)